VASVLAAALSCFTDEDPAVKRNAAFATGVICTYYSSAEMQR
jgi:hypothetical protein